MKKYLFLVAFGFTLCNAQNLVPNPGFENYINCPTVAGEIYQCQNWATYGWSPDYFNSCSPGVTVSVPNNQYGFQYAASGNAYGGFINNSGGPSPPPEYLGAQLSLPLITGLQYFASFKVSFAGFACGTNKMGIRFSTVPFDSLNLPPVNNIAAVHTDSIVSDTINWYQVKGNFIADSNYTYIIVGNFFNNGSGCAAGTYVSYYYVDDICVSTDSMTCYSTVGIDENNIDEIILYPNPVTDKLNIALTNNESSQLILYDICSRKLLQQSFINSVSINTTQLEKGIYFYEVMSGNKIIRTGKVIKE